MGGRFRFSMEQSRAVSLLEQQLLIVRGEMNLFYACLLICVGIQIATPQRLSSTLNDGEVRAELSAPPQKMVQFVGRWISIQCPIQNWGGHRISWSKILSGDNASDLDISSGTKLRVHDDRYSLVEDPATSTMTLKIQNLKTTDSGLYQCTAMSPNGDRRFNRVELEVLQ